MSAVTVTVAEALAHAQSLGLPRIDAQMLLLHSIGQPQAGRAWLLTHDTDAVSAPAWTQFSAWCQRRVAGEPVAYLTGVKEFYGLPLQVDARVLDPRPDTETLVDWALEVVANCTAPRILDLGTGSGAIALALQHQRPDAQVWAVDASHDALAVARSNATRLQLPVQFLHSHWLDGVAGEFDLIVSNPPYITDDDPHLSALRYEPRQALTAGPDGLVDLRTIIAQAPQHLVSGGWLLLEHGWNQASAVLGLLGGQGLHAVQSRHDLSGHARCSGGCTAPLAHQ